MSSGVSVCIFMLSMLSVVWLSNGVAGKHCWLWISSILVIWSLCFCHWRVMLRSIDSRKTTHADMWPFTHYFVQPRDEASSTLLFNSNFTENIWLQKANLAAGLWLVRMKQCSWTIAGDSVPSVFVFVICEKLLKFDSLRCQLSMPKCCHLFDVSCFIQN